MAISCKYVAAPSFSCFLILLFQGPYSNCAGCSVHNGATLHFSHDFTLTLRTKHHLIGVQQLRCTPFGSLS